MNATDPAKAAWEVYRTARLHWRALVERGASEEAIAAQDRVASARFAEAKAAYMGEALERASGAPGTLHRLPGPSSVPTSGPASSLRLRALHGRRLTLNELAASAGTPDEWLASAILHLKIQTSGPEQRSAEVSTAALHLVLMRLEQLEHGGEPWEGNAA